MRTAFPCSCSNNRKLIVSELRNCDSIIIYNKSNDSFKNLVNPNRSSSDLFFKMPVLLEDNISALITSKTYTNLSRDLSYLGINIIETKKMPVSETCSIVIYKEKEVIQ